MKKSSFNLGIYLFVMAALILGYAYFSGQSDPNQKAETLGYSELLDLIESDRVYAVSISEHKLVGIYRPASEKTKDAFPERYDFTANVGDDFLDAAKQAKARGTNQEWQKMSVSDLGFTVEYRDPPETPWWLSLLPTLISLAVITFVFIYFMRGMGSSRGGDRVMGFGKIRSSSLIAPGSNPLRFSDVAGMVEEKEALREIVDFLRTPETYRTMGARIPKGVLLVGPPGTGKTLLAKAVAGEAGVPFYSISGSDFVEMFVGVGASRVRDLFDQAKKNAPSIVFIDEIDAVGRQRGTGMGGGNDEREQTLNQLLVEMDGFASNLGVIVLAATNRSDILDPALTRPGRFDRQVRVNYPDQESRVEILKVYTREKPLAEDIDLENIAKRMPYATGADLENVMNEAAILAARRREEKITQEMLIEAVYRVQMGPEKRSHKVQEKEKRMVAVHESGHAVVGHFLPECEDVHLVTVVPRGASGGHTLSLPQEEHDNLSRTELLDRICMMLGGQAAEEVLLGEIYTGSTSDLEQATRLCRRMITEFGMGSSVGRMYLGGGQEVFLGRDLTSRQEYAEKTAEQVDSEVRQMLDEAFARAKETIKTHLGQMNRLIEALIAEDTVQRADFLRLMKDDVEALADAEG